MAPSAEEQRHFDAWMGFTRWVGAHYNRWVVTGQEHLPREGQGYVLCANHDAFVDAFVLAAAVGGRFVRIFGAGMMMDVPLLGPVLKSVGLKATAVDQGKAQDKTQAAALLREMADHAQGGEAVMIFPEGHTKTWNNATGLHDFHTGAVRLAAMAGVPIAPAAMVGTLYTIPVWQLPTAKRTIAFLPVLLPAKMLVHFGPAFWVDPAAATDKAVAALETERLKSAIASLRSRLALDYGHPAQG